MPLLSDKPFRRINLKLDLSALKGCTVVYMKSSKLYSENQPRVVSQRLRYSISAVPLIEQSAKEKYYIEALIYI